MPAPQLQAQGGSATGVTGASGVSGSTSAAAFTTKLGTITALDGKTYTACQLLKINTDSIVISDADGITQVSLNVLPPLTRKLFGFDAKQGALSNDQVQLLEQQRQAAVASGR